MAQLRGLNNFVKPQNPPKYFGIDVDKTFFIKDSDKFENNIVSFKKLKDKNVVPFFCTGKMMSVVLKNVGQKFVTESGYNGYPGVYADGAIVYDETGNVIQSIAFSQEVLDKIHGFIEKNNLGDKALFFDKDGSYCVEKICNSAMDVFRGFGMTEPLKLDFNEIKAKEIYSITFNHQSFNIEGLTEDVDYRVIKDPSGLSHLQRTNLKKENGVKALATHFQKSADDFAYIGDGDNDKECMKYCKLSFAVGNASEEVKQCAKWVVDIDYDKGAFAKVVQLMYDD